MRRIFLVMLFASALLSTANAVEPDELMEDPVMEARAREVTRELRCVVCQSESIDDSSAPLAKDLRLLVRERIAAGDTNAEARDFVVARYGEYVLLKPKVRSGTLALWIVPSVLLVGGVAGAILFLMRRGKHSASRPDSRENLSYTES